MASPFNSVEDVRNYFADLDAEKCPVGRRTLELRKEREAERERIRKEREAECQHEEQQAEAARNSEAWNAWCDDRVGYAIFDPHGCLHDPFARLIVHERDRRRDEVKVELDKLRNEFKALTNKLYDELRSELDRLHTVNQERRELERTLSQTHLDASNARIDAAIEAATVKLRSEFDVEKLREEFRVGIGRLPIAKVWDPDEVCHRGDVVVTPDGVFQALQDTGKTPAADHPHWILLARSGRDGADGKSPTFRGQFNAHKKYKALDVIEFDGSCLLALRDRPGVPGDDGWMVVSKRGYRGPAGPIGERGPQGERGAKGQDAPVVVSWVLDRARYTAVPTMSDGRGGPPLELRGLFEQFLGETQGWDG
jgi:hypothetical protein